MDLKLFILLILFNFALSEYCSQDEDEGCTFECHCAKKDECRGGLCPGGCETAALGYNWGGVACQTGNIGLYKNANMTLAKAEHNISYPPTGALDGQIVEKGFNNHCANPSNNGTSPAEWWADLGNIYKIHDITIYGRPDCCATRLQQFDLTIYNTSDNEVLCAYYDNIISTNATITCNESVISRYVHFKRKGGPEIYTVALCEVIIIGHRVYDCSNCPDSATCNDDTGCQTCVGSYQPECKPECRDGSYGINCNQRCSVHCKTNNTCDKVSGQCVDGCQLWWADDRCMTSIDKPVHTNESTQILTVSSSSIQIEWEKLKSISANLSQFYGYVVVYKESNTTNYTEVLSRSHNSSGDMFLVDITNLTFNTHYDIQVWTYREMNGQKNFGSTYGGLHVKTSCIAPLVPIILSITETESTDLLPKITVHYQSVIELIPNCREITNISVNYRLAQNDQFHTEAMSLNDNMYTIIPDSEGQYQIWITITNNEGYSSDSQEYIIDIKMARRRPSSGALFSASVTVIAVLVVTICVVVVV